MQLLWKLQQCKCKQGGKASHPLSGPGQQLQPMRLQCRNTEYAIYCTAVGSEFDGGAGTNGALYANVHINVTRRACKALNVLQRAASRPSSALYTL